MDRFRWEGGCIAEHVSVLFLFWWTRVEKTKGMRRGWFENVEENKKKGQRGLRRPGMETNANFLIVGPRREVPRDDLREQKHGKRGWNPSGRKCRCDTSQTQLPLVEEVNYQRVPKENLHSFMRNE